MKVKEVARRYNKAAASGRARGHMTHGRERERARERTFTLQIVIYYS